MTTKTLQPMQSGRFFHSAVFFNGKVYVARGLNASSRDSCLNSVECYDPVEGNWTEIANMNHPRQLFSLVEYGGKLYAMGHHESIEWYNPATNVRTVVGTKSNEYSYILYLRICKLFSMIFRRWQIQEWSMEATS